MMSKIVEIPLNELLVTSLPNKPAVYSILSGEEQSGGLFCKIVGSTYSLRFSIFMHFQPFEPNLDLRHFISSNKNKILRYEILEDISLLSTKKLEWENVLEPEIRQVD